MSSSLTNRQTVTQMLEDRAIPHLYHSISGVLECDITSHGSVTFHFDPGGSLVDVRYTPNEERNKYRAYDAPSEPAATAPGLGREERRRSRRTTPAKKRAARPKGDF